MSKTPLEQKVQNDIMRIIRANGGYVYKNAQSMYTQVGIPDLTACIPIRVDCIGQILGPTSHVGLFVGIEVKREGKLNNVSDAQLIVGKQIMKSNGIWFATDRTDAIELFAQRCKNG